MSSFLNKCHSVLWTLLVLVLGYALGTFMMALEEVSAPAPIQVLQEDIHQYVPVVRVQEINRGNIIGSIDAGTRLVMADSVIIPESDGSFSVPARPFLVNIIDVKIPEGMHFVASKRGKKYYAVTSSAGQKLNPENRRYFRTEGEAEAAGYRK